MRLLILVLGVIIGFTLICVSEVLARNEDNSVKLFAVVVGILGLSLASLSLTLLTI